ncbi:hypothetical protein ACGFJC_15980 [Nonomuraea fuscirosea]|uniref:hypothetical protein n=1 Tax=Nonomuraea fuscirosea TaxID=1291556 RepID=UPI00342DB85C
MTTTQQPSSMVPSRGARRAQRRAGGAGGGAKALAALAGVALIAVAMWVQSHHMSDLQTSDPLVYSGAKGETVDARRFSVRLENFVAAKSIKSGDKTLQTDQIFLILTVKATSALKPYHLGEPVLTTAEGKKFAATDRVDNSLSLASKWVQPDIWRAGQSFFEVPPSALAGATVTYALPGSFLVESYQPEIEIDLGLDEEGARKLATSAQAVYSTDKK